MLENISWNRKLLAAVGGVNLALAIGVSAGAVPHPGDNRSVQAASVSAAQEIAAPATRQPGDGVSAAVAAPTPSTVATTTTVAAPRTTTAPPTTKAPVKRTTTTVAAAAPAPVAAAAAPVAPVKVPRRTPTAAEVQAAITELKRQVGGVLLLVSPTPAQIDQAGDQICTAFDNGQTFAQVKATGLSMIPASVTVSPATVDWAVRQAVTMYCPGHASKLV